MEYKLKSDTVKTTQVILAVQAPNLICNDQVTIPFATDCGVMITPDDLLENACDTITDTMYYHITLMGLDKKGKESVLAAGGGKGGQYPFITSEMLSVCGGAITASIERRYYEGLDLTFCNSGTQAVSCDVNVSIIDQSAPLITNLAASDTLITCSLDLTQEGLGLTSPAAIDNCSESTVDLKDIRIVTQGTAVCDTSRVEVIWQATDDCGNETTATQLVVLIRPRLEDIVKTGLISYTCDTTITAEEITIVPGIKIGKLKNGTLEPTDTIPLSTEIYTCGYILEKRDIEVSTINSGESDASCGRKIYRYWSIFDWCDADGRIIPIDTTFIEFKDTIAPQFVDGAVVNTVIELDPLSCTYDITEISQPEAIDNCSVPTVFLSSVSRIENGEEWDITSVDWTTLDCDSFKLEWVAQDACPEQLINDTIEQIIEIKDVTKPSTICADRINLSLGKETTRLHYLDIDNGSYDACSIAKYEVSRDEIYWDSIVVFSCEDVHEVVPVYLRVTDEKGNQNICWMMVNVEDKIQPICTDLPDITKTCDENYIELPASSDTDNDKQMEENEWIDMDTELMEYFNTQYGNPNCSDSKKCDSLTIKQQYQLIEKDCGEIVMKRRYQAVDWDGKGLTSNWSEQAITIESKSDWSITLPADWQGYCGDEIPESVLDINNGACDLLAYEVEEKIFTITEKACLKIIRTFTIINWCKYEVGGETRTIARIENEEGMVTSPTIFTSEGNENVGKLEYIQILKLDSIGAQNMTQISGTILDWQERPVEGVVIKANNTTSIARGNGEYSFNLPMDYEYIIEPSKDDNPLNGVSTFDLVLISKHILGISSFKNPYQMIAADVNRSGSITAFDMVQLRQLILNINKKFNNNTSWRFVDAAHEFTLGNPIIENLPEVIYTKSLAHDMVKNFVAIKVGDVNGNALPNSLMEAVGRNTSKVFEIETVDKVLKAGQTYTCSFATKQLTDIQGYQFTMDYSGLKFVKLQRGVIDAENFGLHRMGEGIITTSWNQQLSDKTKQVTKSSADLPVVLFTVEFTALRDGKLSDLLNLANQPTQIEAYDNDDELMDIQLTFTTPSHEDKFILYQNQPNPFHDETTIGFYLPQASDIQLILRDETGRIIHSFKDSRPKGFNTIYLDKNELQNGLIYYQLTTKFGSKAKKMLKLN